MRYTRAVITGFGGPEVLEVVEEDSLPEPGPGDVRVRTLAAGVGFTDVMIRKAMYPDVKTKPPFTPGYDLVGVVDHLGPGVTGLQRGQRVAALTVIGAQAEYLCLPAETLTLVPDDVDAAEAAAIILSYVTAYQMLHRVVCIEAGGRILVHGAGGAVGTALLQLGRLLDLEMYGTASKPKHETVAGLGATPIDYRGENWLERIRALTGDGVDAVFDPIGGDNFKQSFRALRPKGTLVAYGFYNAVRGNGGSIPLDFLRLKLWNFFPNSCAATFYSISGLRRKQPHWFSEDLAALFKLLADGGIRPLISRKLPLTEVRQAHELIERAALPGKIVLVP